MLSDSCGGCRYCEFPYDAEVPVKTKTGFKKRTFNNSDDVWEVVDLLIEETKSVNKQEGGNFDIASNVAFQLPFFACINHIRDESCLKLLNKYVLNL